MPLFAGPENPIRCSKLAAICKCSARLYMLNISDEDELGGPPAQTGSLTHEGVAEFHRQQGKSLDFRKGAAWEAIQKAAEKFPLADADEVRLLLTPYMNDPRNINANCLKVEWEIDFTLPPHELDDYRTPIYVTGHIDQVRMGANNLPRVDDYKTGKKTGWEMIHDYAIQLAAYTYGAREKGFPLAEPGYIIRGMGYRTRTVLSTSPDGVFFAAPFGSESLTSILESVRLHVAIVRKGYVTLGPGPHCTYCEHGGLTNCAPKLNSLIQLNSKGS